MIRQFSPAPISRMTPSIVISNLARLFQAARSVKGFEGTSTVYVPKAR